MASYKTYRSYIEVNARYDKFGASNFNEGSYVYWRNKSQFITLPDEAKAAAYQVAVDTAAYMKAAAPKGDNRGRRPSEKRPPGRLQKAIKATKADNGGYVEWNSLNTAPHWQAVEFGAKPHIISGPNGISFRAKGIYGSANPGTGKQNKKMVKGKNGKLVSQGNKPRKGDINVPYVKHPGNKAQPYVRPSIAWGEEELWRRVVGLGGKMQHPDTGHFLGDTVHQKARKSLSRGGKKPL